MSFAGANNGPAETPREHLPQTPAEQRMQEREAGADAVYERMIEKSKTDPEMAELLNLDVEKDPQKPVEKLTEKQVEQADYAITNVVEKLAAAENARLTLHPDGRMEVEGPVNKIAELIAAAKERQRSA